MLVRDFTPGLAFRAVRRACFVMALLSAALIAPAGAQTDTGAIAGIVQDTGNARLPGATVEVTNEATDVTQNFVTNADGLYQSLQLIPGTYTVTVKHTGFGTQVRQGVTVSVQSRVQVDFSLGVSSVQQQVVVKEAIAQLQTESAEVNNVLSTKTVNDLPLNGRDYDQLALLQPGVYHDPNGEVANLAEGRFSSNGNLELQNYFSLDGVDNNTGSENLQEQSAQG